MLDKVQTFYNISNEYVVNALEATSRRYSVLELSSCVRCSRLSLHRVFLGLYHGMISEGIFLMRYR